MRYGQTCFNRLPVELEGGAAPVGGQNLVLLSSAQLAQGPPAGCGFLVAQPRAPQVNGKGETAMGQEDGSAAS